MKMNRQKLRSVVVQIRHQLPHFNTRLVTREEINKEGTYDPPCNVARIQFGPLEVDLCDDGEIYCNMSGDYFQINVLQDPKQIAADFIEKAKGLTMTTV